LLMSVPIKNFTKEVSRLACRGEGVHRDGKGEEGRVPMVGASIFFGYERGITLGGDRSGKKKRFENFFYNRVQAEGGPPPLAQKEKSFNARVGKNPGTEKKGKKRGAALSGRKKDGPGKVLRRTPVCGKALSGGRLGGPEKTSNQSAPKGPS